MKLIYVAYGQVSVFDSQVVSLLNFYIESGNFDEIIVLIGLDYKKDSISDKKAKLDTRISVIYYKQYPQYFLIENLTVQSMAKALKKIPRIEDYVIHVRNEVTAHYVFKALQKLSIVSDKIIADVRGAGLEQLIEFSNKNKLILWLKTNQRNRVNKTLNKIRNLSVVSNSLKEYVYNKIGRDVNVKVNSCLSNKNFEFNEIERNELRKKLKIGVDENLLVLSTGGDNTWQNTRETINTLTNKNFKILNLSRTQIDNKNVITKFVPYNEMFKYLCAADAAIIFRKKSVTNQVASPVKFSEYVSCGLPVITNDSIDLITDYVNANNCGYILNSLDLITEDVLKSMKSLDRKTISIKGQLDFGIETIANQYIEFYKDI